MLQMIFARRADGSVAPRTPRERDGSPRKPDGIATFNLSQAAEVFGLSEDALRSIYEETFGDLFTDDDDPHSPVASEKTSQIRRDLLRAIRFPDLNDIEFDAVLDGCFRRNLDPWRHIFADVQISQRGRRDLKIITTIDAFRLLADRTGKSRGLAIWQIALAPRTAPQAGGLFCRAATRQFEAGRGVAKR